MKQSCENNSNPAEDVKVIDKLYGEANDKFSEENAGLKKTLSLWRTTRVEETPPPGVKERVLKEAERQKSSWRDLFLLPIRKPAFGIGFFAVCVLGVVFFYNYVSKKPATEKKTQTELSDQQHETIVALQDKRRIPSRTSRIFVKSEEMDKDIEVAERTVVRQDIPAEESLRGMGGLVRPEQRAREQENEKVTMDRVTSDQTGLLSETASSAAPEETKEEEDKRARARRDTVAGFAAADEVMTRKAEEVTTPPATASFETAIQLQGQQKHKQAGKFFGKAYKEAKKNRQRDLILLKWAESESALGNKEQTVKLTAKIRNRKRWIKEIQRIEKTAGAGKKP